MRRTSKLSPQLRRGRESVQSNQPASPLQALADVLQRAQAFASETQPGKSLASVRQHARLLAELEGSKAHVEELRRRLEDPAASHPAALTEVLEGQWRAQAAEQQTRRQLEDAVAVIEDLRHAGKAGGAAAPLQQQRQTHPPGRQAVLRQQELEAELRTVREQRDSTAAALAETKAELREVREASSGAAASQSQEAQASIAELRAAKDAAEATARRHRDVVASVTADNLMFMLRAKSAEARAEAAAAEAAQLRAAALEGRDPWLAQMRDDVEQRVGEALQRAADAEAAMRDACTQNASCLAVAQAAAVQAQDTAAAAAQREQDAQQQLHGILAERDRLQEELAAGEQGREEQRQRIAELAAQCHAQEARVAEMKTECAAAQAQLADAVQKQRQLSEQAASAAMDAAAAAARARHSRAEAASQAAVNKLLMERKQDLEWQLMAALAAAGVDKAGDGARKPENVLQLEPLCGSLKVAADAVTAASGSEPYGSPQRPFTDVTG